MRLSILFAICLTTTLAWAAPASAGTVCLDGGIATFRAADLGAACPAGVDGPGELNALTVSVNSAGDVVFTDSAPVSDGDGSGGCTASGNTGTCPGAVGFSFDLGDGDDSATVGAVANGGRISTGGDGKDTLIGGPLADNLDGGLNDDVVAEPGTTRSPVARAPINCVAAQAPTGCTEVTDRTTSMAARAPTHSAVTKATTPSRAATTTTRSTAAPWPGASGARARTS
jgi:hypothetical protein